MKSVENELRLEIPLVWRVVPKMREGLREACRPLSAGSILPYVKWKVDSHVAQIAIAIRRELGFYEKR